MQGRFERGPRVGAVAQILPHAGFGADVDLPGSVGHDRAVLLQGVGDGFSEGVCVQRVDVHGRCEADALPVHEFPAVAAVVPVRGPARPSRVEDRRQIQRVLDDAFRSASRGRFGLGLRRFGDGDGHRGERQPGRGHPERCRERRVGLGHVVDTSTPRGHRRVLVEPLELPELPQPVRGGVVDGDVPVRACRRDSMVGDGHVGVVAGAGQLVGVETADGCDVVAGCVRVRDGHRARVGVGVERGDTRRIPGDLDLVDEVFHERVVGGRVRVVARPGEGRVGYVTDPDGVVIGLKQTL